MKIAISVIIMMFLVNILAAQEDSYQYSIQFEIVEGGNDSIAYLGHHFGDKRYVDDTASVSDGRSLFAGNKQLKEGLYFYYSGNHYFEFIIDDDTDFQIKTRAGDYVNQMEIAGSEQNSTFLEMQLFVNAKKVELEQLTSAIEAEQDSNKIEQLTADYKRLDDEIKQYQNEIAENNEGLLISRMMYTLQRPEITTGESSELSDEEKYLLYKEKFVEHFDFADEGLLRTPLYQPRLMEYLDKVIIQDPDSVIAEVDRIMSMASQSTEIYRYLTVTLASKYENAPIMGHDKVFAHFVEKYYLQESPEWLDAEVKKNLQERIATMKYSYIGMEAPKIVLNDTAMNIIPLYGIDARYIVMYFYDPDCGHCKKKTPVMLEAFHNLSDADVKFLGINITTDEVRWKEYIKESNLDWINLSDQYNRSNFRYYYDIRSTPTIYILDDEKKIIAKKLDATQVEEFIRQDMKRSQNSESSGH